MNPVPVTDFERNTNLTVLQEQLHDEMKCFAGKNKVYLQSFIQENGEKTRPRIALKCHLRAEFGMDKHVYYEYIRDVCCGDPRKCPAFLKFLKKNPDAAKALKATHTNGAATNGTGTTPGYKPPSRPVL